MLLRVGNTIINLDNVLQVDLNWIQEGNEEAGPQVVIEFSMRGWDELDEGANIAQPYRGFFEGKEADAIRKYLKTICPDLLAGD